MSSELESDVYYRVHGWHHLVKATEVTAGLVESNGRLLPGGWLKFPCRLTACTLASAPGPTLSNKYGRTLSYLLDVWHKAISGWQLIIDYTHKFFCLHNIMSNLPSEPCASSIQTPPPSPLFTSYVLLILFLFPTLSSLLSQSNILPWKG